MSVKVKVTLKSWKGRTAVDLVNARLARGVMMAAADVAQSARSRAPRGKSTFGQPERIEAVGPLFAGRSNRDIARLARQAIGQGADIQRLREEFQFTRGGLKAPAPDRLVLSRGFIRGQRENRHLRDSIEVVGPTKGDHQVGARVIAPVKHAKPIEYGFRHKGGFRKKSGKTTQVAARPFMRPALAEHSEPYRTGKYFKG